MSQIDDYFNDEIKAIAIDSRAIARGLAYELQRDVFRQIRQNFNNPSAAFSRGVKVYEFEQASYVRLSPILSVHAARFGYEASHPKAAAAEKTKLRGSPNLWILLPDGQRLGFKRIGKGFTWSDLKRRYGTRLSFVPVDDGSVVLFRSDQGVKPIYKIQSQVITKQRIEFYEKAEEIAEREGFTYERDGKEISFK